MPKTYTFHVSIPGTGRVWRKVELRADQNLAELHMAILDAFGWVPDRAYAFYIGGDFGDRAAEYRAPRDAAPDAVEPLERDHELSSADAYMAYRLTQRTDTEAINGIRRVFGGGMWDPIMGGPPMPTNTLTTRLRDLDLQEDDTFWYVFDPVERPFVMFRKQPAYREAKEAERARRFQARVHAINPDAEEADYPRVVERVGKAPPQSHA
jgi:hypothetical protein